MTFNSDLVARTRLLTYLCNLSFWNQPRKSPSLFGIGAQSGGGRVFVRPMLLRKLSLVCCKQLHEVEEWSPWLVLAVPFTRLVTILKDVRWVRVARQLVSVHPFASKRKV